MTEQDWLESVEPTPMLEFLRVVARDRKLRLFACACCRRVWDLITTPCSRTAIEVAEQFADGLISEQERFRAFAAAIQVANGWANCCGADDAAFGAGVSAAAFAVSEPETVENAGNAVVMAEVNFPDFMRAPTLIAAFDTSAGAGAAAGAWVQGVQDDDLGEGEGDEWKATAIAVGAIRAAAVGVPEVTPETDWGEVQQKVREAEEKAQCDLLRDIFSNPFRPMAVVDPAWLTSTVHSLARQMYESRDFSPMPILADALMDAGCENEEILDHLRGDGPHVRGCWALDLILGKE